MTPSNIYSVLTQTAERYPEEGILFYHPGNLNTVGTALKYPALLQLARENASFLHQLGLRSDSVILLHFKNHLDNVVWFWSVICAGFIPALSTPFTNNLEQRRKHITHLHTLLHDPICLTREELFSEFDSQDLLRLQAIDNISKASSKINGFGLRNGLHSPVEQGKSKTPDDLAVLMLTSGSTGNAKAVCLHHGQIISSISSTSKLHGTAEHRVFLNWIGFDHVACLTENHLHALWVGSTQVMAQAEDIVPFPLQFLKLIEKHRVALSFAPNFFLNGLLSALEGKPSTFDLSSLKAIITGGEANVLETCVALSEILQTYGTPRNVLRPAFGMTETCGGVIYNLDSPRYDIKQNHEFCSVGHSVDVVKMRITDDNGKVLGCNEQGNLELRGSPVFSTYYNNPKGTAESFSGEWFKTGDRGVIDSLGSLLLTGRSKETVIINGVNYSPHEIESTLDQISGAKPSYTVAFAYRPKGSQTESLAVVYLPTYEPDDIDMLVKTHDEISKMVMQQTGTRPCVIPLNDTILQKSTLGKLPRAKLRLAFEKSDFKAFQESHEKAIARYRAAHYQGPTNPMEELVLKAFEEVLGLAQYDLGISTNIFALGLDSIGLIKLKQRLQDDLGMEIPIIILMTNGTIRTIAMALEDRQKPRVYDPMVVLQAHGSKLPLWLIHPGVGEILVFLKLASHLTDRPVYAMRARGFEKGEPYFKSIEEVVTTYYKRIKEKQPKGPYAIAGYSYGSMIAFEITKLLLHNKDTVKFLGIFNLPPHISFRMRQLDWTNCVLHLSYFLDFFSEEYAHAQHPILQKLSKKEVLDHIVRVAPPERMSELGLDRERLANWADLAYSLQSSAIDYEPSGMVDNIDVFCATPLASVSKNMEDWQANHLSKWADFCHTQPRLHVVDGAHYTMIGPENVYSFQKKLKAAFQERGI